MDATTKVCSEELTPKVLAELRDNKHTWTILDLSRQPATVRENWEALTTALFQNTRLEELYLEENRLEHVQLLCDLLANHAHCALRVLDLGANRMDNQEAQQLAQALTTNSSLTELYINNNVIGDKGGRALLEAFSSHTTLNVMDLFWVTVPV